MCFAPVVGLLCAHCHARTSTERERQRKVGHTARPYVFIFKTTSFTNAPRLLCDVFLDFPSARLIAAERRQKVVRSAKRSLTSIVSHIIRAGCLPATYTLPRVCFGKARTPTEARRAAPRLGSYSQDNDVQGDTLTRAAFLHRFLGLSLRSCFAPVVCLQHTRCRVYVSAKRERQRNSGQPVLR